MLGRLYLIVSVSLTKTVIGNSNKKNVGQRINGCSHFTSEKFRRNRKNNGRDIIKYIVITSERLRNKISCMCCVSNVQCLRHNCFKKIKIVCFKVFYLFTSLVEIASEIRYITCFYVFSLKSPLPWEIIIFLFFLTFCDGNIIRHQNPSE